MLCLVSSGRQLQLYVLVLQSIRIAENKVLSIHPLLCVLALFPCVHAYNFLTNHFHSLPRFKARLEPSDHGVCSVKREEEKTRTKHRTMTHSCSEKVVSLKLSDVSGFQS